MSSGRGPCIHLQLPTCTAGAPASGWSGGLVGRVTVERHAAVGLNLGPPATQPAHLHQLSHASLVSLLVAQHSARRSDHISYCIDLLGTVDASVELLRPVSACLPQSAPALSVDTVPVRFIVLSLQPRRQRQSLPPSISPPALLGASRRQPFASPLALQKALQNDCVDLSCLGSHHLLKPGHHQAQAAADDDLISVCKS